jgi:hypothetical protein
MRALDPSLVTITIGGDDVGFPSIIEECYLKSILHAHGWCVSQLKKEATVIRAFGGKAVGYYRLLRKDARSARVIVVGYPRIFPPPGTKTHGCSWLNAAEQQEFYKLAGELNSVLSAAAKTAGLGYVSTLAALGGHELCTKTPWLNSIRNTVSGLRHYYYYAHPNLNGQKALSRVVEAAGRL